MESTSSTRRSASTVSSEPMETRRVFTRSAAARTASEAQAGGSLTEAQDGVRSLFMTATDYSPIR